MTIHKLLIANRGEIAVRIIRAARELGGATVQVYSKADKEQLAVRLADESVEIGPAQASKSYLNRDAILAAAKATVSHCPCSNAALGSGWFPLRRHVQTGVRCALGTDVGGGTGFGLLKEGLQAYMMQRLAPGGFPLGPAHMLYLATRAGAVALGAKRGLDRGPQLLGRRRPPLEQLGIDGARGGADEQEDCEDGESAAGGHAATLEPGANPRLMPG